MEDDDVLPTIYSLAANCKYHPLSYSHVKNEKESLYGKIQ